MAIRMKMSVNASIFHRLAAINDAAGHDVSTSAANSSGLGGSGDFQIDSDDDITIGTAHQVVDETEAAIGSGSCANFLYIKNTGYTSSAKTTAVGEASYITVGIGGAYAAGGFKLYAGQAIILPGMSAGSDNLSECQIDSSVAATYVEITYA